MILLEMKKRSIKLANNFSSGGNVISLSDPNQMDFVLKINSLCDDAQKEIATTAKKISAVMRLSQYPVVNALPSPIYMFDIVEHTTQDISYIAQGAKAYYFEVDNVADIYIEEQVNGVWQALPTPIHLQQLTKPTGYSTGFKGFIVALNASNNIRIRFSGNYEYRIRYIALYTSNFNTLADIPPYTRYNLYPMPDDYFELKPEGITFKGNQSDGYPYQKTADYYWEYDSTGKSVIAINYYNKGEYMIPYYRYPTTIDDSTLDTYNFELDTEAQRLIPYYVAGNLLLSDDIAVATMLLNQYQTMLARLQNTDIYGIETIENTTGW